MGGRTTLHLRRLMAAAVAALAVLAVATLPQAPASAQDPAQAILPDLVPDNPEDLELDDVGGDGSPPRRLLRFDAFLHNAGPGILEIRGSDPDGAEAPRMRTVTQRLYEGKTRRSAFRDVPIDPLPRLEYQTILGHDHFHLFEPVSYYLVGTGESSTNLLYSKASIGFCFVDTEQVEAGADSVAEFTQETNGYCEQGNRAATSVFMGLSPGWRDVYDDELPLQYMDVSNVRPGSYRISTVTDPRDHIIELNEANNRSSADSDPRVTLPGYTARGAVQRTSQGVPLLVELTSHRFESTLPGAEAPGAAEYLVTDGPRHGRLVDTSRGGGWGDARRLYVPEPGFTGEDSITFAVRDSDHPDFPYDLSTATVRIRVQPVA